MKIEELYEGRVFKNYKDLCETLNIPVKTSNSKKSQIKELSRFCLINQKGHTITIERLYKNPLVLPENRGGKRVSTPLLKSHPIMSNEWIEERNGILTDSITRTTEGNFWWKCSKCHREIYSSMQKRFRKKGKVTDEDVGCSYCVLSEGAKLVADILTKFNLKFITEKTFYGLVGIGSGLLKYDFSILSSDDRVKFLVEYDGEFHFYEIGGSSPEESKKRLEIQHEHDKRKNNYCKDNAISLTRIYFFDDEATIHRKIKEAVLNYSNNIHHVSPAPYEVEPTNLFLLNRVSGIDKDLALKKKQIENLRLEVESLEKEKIDIKSEIKYI